ncbi:MAG: hypothetical protein PHF63_14130, partial [Herbinix sp.]|nr:hypothetical protein [Herbinix sp.]
MKNILSIILILLSAILYCEEIMVGPGSTYTTIQSAIDYAINTVGTANIRVLGGYYTENLIIDFNDTSLTNLTIERYNSQACTIIGSASTAISITGTVNNTFELNGFEIRNPGRKGINSSEVNIFIRNCTFNLLKIAAHIGGWNGDFNFPTYASFEIDNCIFNVTEGLYISDPYLNISSFRDNNVFLNSTITDYAPDVNCSSSKVVGFHSVKSVYIAHNQFSQAMNNDNYLFNISNSDVTFNLNNIDGSNTVGIPTFLIGNYSTVSFTENALNNCYISFPYIESFSNKIEMLNNSIVSLHGSIKANVVNIVNNYIDNRYSYVISIGIEGNSSITGNIIKGTRISLGKNSGSTSDSYSLVNNSISSSFSELLNLKSGVNLNFNQNTVYLESQYETIKLESGYTNTSIDSFYNNIIWSYGNLFSGNYNNLPELEINYCCINSTIPSEFLPPINNNISTDPQFYDPDNGNFQLRAISPCIDAGDPDTNGNGVAYEPYDLDPYGSRKEMGCYPYEETIDTKWYRNNRYNWISLPRLTNNGGMEASTVFAMQNIVNPDPNSILVDIADENNDPTYTQPNWQNGNTPLGSKAAYKVRMEGSTNYYRQNVTGNVLPETATLILYPNQNNW